MSTKKYKISFPIGDWSGDGHNQQEIYRVLSDKPVEDVREAHYAMKKKFGISVEEFADEYEDSQIPANVISVLKVLGFDIKSLDETKYFDETFYATAEDMFKIWIFLLNKVDPDLNLTEVEDDFESIAFYGFDKKKRHISLVGYGCFSF